ncbi:MAG: hypothetical protein ACOC4Y_02400 [bacterium]
MSIGKLTSLVILSLLLLGCGLKEGVVQSEPQSYLWFTGNTEDAVVFIDDNSPIRLKGPVITNEKMPEKTELDRSLIHYAIRPGKHHIIVKRSGIEVVNRVLLLGSGMTKEIRIP